jgi:hypothetical protein
VVASSAVHRAGSAIRRSSWRVLAVQIPACPFPTLHIY